MKNLVKASVLVVGLSLLAGCSGTQFNKDRTCSYDYLLHPSISVSKAVGGCGE